MYEQCHACGSISGVYLQLCDDCMTELNKLKAEIEELRDELDLEKVRCPRCGGFWFVPKQLFGDPRFDCPHCAEKQEGKADV